MLSKNDQQTSFIDFAQSVIYTLKSSQHKPKPAQLKTWSNFTLIFLSTNQIPPITTGAEAIGSRSSAGRGTPAPSCSTSAGTWTTRALWRKVWASRWRSWLRGTAAEWGADGTIYWPSFPVVHRPLSFPRRFVFFVEICMLMYMTI